MATRSTIAIEHADGTVHQVYCHWDGYLENNGDILLGHYTDTAKTAELVSLGDMSSLDKAVYPRGEHSWEGPETDVTVFYGRDRGETGDHLGPRKFDSFEDYLENRQTEEYDYVQCSNGKWLVCHVARMGSHHFEDLVCELAEVMT